MNRPKITMSKDTIRMYNCFSQHCNKINKQIDEYCYMHDVPECMNAQKCILCGTYVLIGDDIYPNYKHMLHADCVYLQFCLRL